VRRFFSPNTIDVHDAARMQISSPAGNYRWIENWVTIPESPDGLVNGRTHGVAVTRDGRIIIFHQADPAVLIYSPEGTLLDAWGSFPGAHGLTMIEENGVELLWLVDEKTKAVVKTTLSGEVLQSLPMPEHEAYREGNYIPTWLAVDEIRHGGDGGLWLADGYGSSLVHHFDASGNHLQTLDGTEGAGRFDCPHGLGFRLRGGTSELYIADRGNRRFQVYDRAGKFLRSFGEDFLTSPDVCAPCGGLLIVPELCSRLTVLDERDAPLAILGANDEVMHAEGWPNNRDLVVPGKFNSPHGAAADASGNLYVVEWITGGRITKLEKIS
jgi:DNA-binding beta-propeller fold protein YncE